MAQRPAPALSIVIPGYNEEQNVAAVVAEARAALDASRWMGQYELILVNDGSSDGTGAVMDRLAAAHPEVVAYHHAENRGFGAALRTGFTRSRGERVSLLTADGEFGPDQVLKLLDAMGDADLIVSRRERNATLQREWLSAGAIMLIRLLIGISPDGITGIYAVRGAVLRQLQLYSDTGLANIEVVMRCREMGCTIATSVTQVRPRLSGESKVTNLSTILQTLYELTKLRLTGRHYRRTAQG
jgi:glycosyltransferase involved in cell wall biosynthesis